MSWIPRDWMVVPIRHYFPSLWTRYIGWRPTLGAAHGTLGLLLNGEAEEAPNILVHPPFAHSFCLEEFVQKGCGDRDVLALLGEPEKEMCP